jgi:hypothetical protein
MLDVTILSEKKRKEKSQMGYKYLIQNEYGQGENAFRTKNGFVNWLRKCNLRIDLNNFSKYRWIIKGQRTFNIIGEVELIYNIKKNDIPKNTKPIAWLLNGSYRICYAEKLDYGCKIYAQNYSEIKTLPYKWY